MRARAAFDRHEAEAEAGESAEALTPRAYAAARRPLAGPPAILSVSGFGPENLEGAPYASRHASR